RVPVSWDGAGLVGAVRRRLDGDWGTGQPTRRANGGKPWSSRRTRSSSYCARAARTTRPTAPTTSCPTKSTPTSTATCSTSSASTPGRCSAASATSSASEAGPGAAEGAPLDGKKRQPRGEKVTEMTHAYDWSGRTLVGSDG